MKTPGTLFAVGSDVAVALVGDQLQRLRYSGTSAVREVLPLPPGVRGEDVAVLSAWPSIITLGGDFHVYANAQHRWERAGNVLEVPVVKAPPKREPMTHRWPTDPDFPVPLFEVEILASVALGGRVGDAEARDRAFLPFASVYPLVKRGRAKPLDRPAWECELKRARRAAEIERYGVEQR